MTRNKTNKKKIKKMLHLCTFKTPPFGGVMSDKGNSYHALKKCEGVKTHFRICYESSSNPQDSNLAMFLG